MSAKTLSKTVKPLTVSLATMLILTLISSASAATSITANYSLQANRSNSVQRSFNVTMNGHTTFLIEDRSESLTANGAATVQWMDKTVSANGTITLTRTAQFSINRNGSATNGQETEKTTLNFTGLGEEALDHFGPLMGHPDGGTMQNLTLMNGQTYQAICVSRSFSNQLTGTSTETYTKTENGHTFTVTVTRNVSRNIDLTAQFCFSKLSGILLKSAISGNISVQVTANGSISSSQGNASFTMSATYKETFSRTVTATSISGLSG